MSNRGNDQNKMSSFLKLVVIGVGAVGVVYGVVRYLLNLEEEHQRSHTERPSRSRAPPRQSPSSDNDIVIEGKECQICSRVQDELVVFLPCMHCISCISCAARIQRCLTCRSSIAERITEISNKTIPFNREDDKTCPICLDNQKRIVFNCGHTVCTRCSNRLKSCPMCRVDITSRTEFF